MGTVKICSAVFIEKNFVWKTARLTKSSQFWYIDSFPCWKVSICYDCSDWSERVVFVTEFFSIFIIIFYFIIMLFISFNLFICRYYDVFMHFLILLYSVDSFCILHTMFLWYFVSKKLTVQVFPEEDKEYMRWKFGKYSYLFLPCWIYTIIFNPLMPSGSFNICCPRDCVSRTANVEGTARH